MVSRPCSRPFSTIITIPLEHSYRDKISMRFSPFKKTLFLDTDTHILGPIDQLFRLLDRFDVFFSAADGGLHYELEGVPMDAFPEPSAGVIGWTKSDRTARFFALWDQYYLEQERANGEGAWDQRSMRAALWWSDVSLASLPSVWQLYTFCTASMIGPVRIVHGRDRRLPSVIASANRHLGIRFYVPDLGFFELEAGRFGSLFPSFRERPCLFSERLRERFCITLVSGGCQTIDGLCRRL